MLLAGFEPEEESPIVFLRLRKAVGSSAALAVFADRPVRAPTGCASCAAALLQTAPGQEAELLAALVVDDDGSTRRVAVEPRRR